MLTPCACCVCVSTVYAVCVCLLCAVCCVLCVCAPECVLCVACCVYAVCVGCVLCVVCVGCVLCVVCCVYAPQSGTRPRAWDPSRARRLRQSPLESACSRVYTLPDTPQSLGPVSRAPAPTEPSKERV